MGNSIQKSEQKSMDEKKEKECKVDSEVDITKMPLSEACRLYYREKVFPMEEALCLDGVYQPPLAESEFSAPPVLLFMGPFSSGKTTMIRHLLKMDYPGMTIGPEPSIERYSIIMYGQRQLLNAQTMVGDENFPFYEIWRFGAGYLSKTFCAYCPANLLRNFIVVDTPGVTTFDQKYISRDYNHEGVVRYWADRADKIILVFDVFKLDLSEEVKQVVNYIQPFEEKCIVVLNKADAVSPTELHRAIDSLTWSLARIFRQNELITVHVGSFWEKGTNDMNLQVVVAEYEKQILQLLSQAEKEVDFRRLADVILRAKITYVHGLVSRMLTKRYTEKQMNAKNLQRHVLARLQKTIYPKLARKYNIQAADFPHPMAIFRQITDPCYDITKYPVSRRQMTTIRHFLNKELPVLMKNVPNQAIENRQFKVPQIGAHQTGHPLMTDDWCSVKIAAKEHDWKARFHALKPCKGRLNWTQMKLTMDMTGLSTTTLLYIWSLVDTDKDGRISEKQFYLFNWLVERALSERPLPSEIPKELRPPEHEKNDRCRQKRRVKRRTVYRKHPMVKKR